MDLNKMTLDEVLKYCHERDMWLLNLFVRNEGFEKACIILADNGRI